MAKKKPNLMELIERGMENIDLSFLDSNDSERILDIAESIHTSLDEECNLRKKSLLEKKEEGNISEEEKAELRGICAFPNNPRGQELVCKKNLGLLSEEENGELRILYTQDSVKEFLKLALDQTDGLAKIYFQVLEEKGRALYEEYRTNHPDERRCYEFSERLIEGLGGYQNFLYYIGYEEHTVAKFETEKGWIVVDITFDQFRKNGEERGLVIVPLEEHFNMMRELGLIVREFF